MKATKISTVVCLAALMAACSNEEWEVNKSNTVLDGRKVVDLELTAGYDEASTRFAVGEGGEFLLMKNDVMGAVIVDPTTLWSVEANKRLAIIALKTHWVKANRLLKQTILQMEQP